MTFSLPPKIQSILPEGTIQSFLARIPLFKPLKHKDIEKVAEIIKQVEYPPNVILFQEGDPGDRLYIIIDGRLEIIKSMGTANEHLLRVCEPGEHIGEMSFLSPEGVRSASVRTLNTVQLMELARNDFEVLLSHRPSLALNIACTLNQRFADLENRLLRELRTKNRQLAILLKVLRSSELTKPELEKESFEWANEINEKSVISCPGVPCLYIRTLGHFHVFRGESPIGEREWKGNQPKLLLKAIIARGSRCVPKDLLIEDIWQENVSRFGEQNFKVILHHLRKTLEPILDARRKSSYIILKGNLVSLNRELCHVDLDEFLFLYRWGRKAEDIGDMKQALQLNRAAIEAYQGHFLADDLYLSWARTKREELRGYYVDLLFRTADLYDIRGSSQKAVECLSKITQNDPTFEQAYQKLMLLYSRRGMRAKALKIYKQCQENLQRELGVIPDKLTTAIYEKIFETP